MDDWDQLTDLGDCGALCGMTLLDLQPPLILDWMGLDRVTLDRT